MSETVTRRVLLIAFSDAGHLNPFLSVAASLEAAGHETAIVSAQGDLSGALASAGLRTTYLGAAVSSQAPIDQRSTRFTERVRNPAWLRRWLAGGLIEGAPAAVEPIRAAIRSYAPDVVALDPMCYAGCIAAELERVPWAGLSTGFFALTPPTWNVPIAQVFEQLSAPRAALFERYGLAPATRGADVVSPWLNVVFTSEAFVPRSLSENHDAFHVGPAAPPSRARDLAFPWEKLPSDRPIVYVSFGSQLNPSAELYQRVFASLTPDEAFFVVTLKDLMDDPFVAGLPSNVLAVAYAPQLALLERARVMLTHGGANSVMECLTRGCPMLVVPFAYDQGVLARLVATRGLGLAVEPEELTTERCRESLLQLLRDRDEIRGRMTEVQRASGEGGPGAARLLARLAAERRALRPEVG